MTGLVVRCSRQVFSLPHPGLESRGPVSELAIGRRAVRGRGGLPTRTATNAMLPTVGIATPISGAPWHTQEHTLQPADSASPCDCVCLLSYRRGAHTQSPELQSESVPEWPAVRTAVGCRNVPAAERRLRRLHASVLRLGPIWHRNPPYWPAGSSWPLRRQAGLIPFHPRCRAYTRVTLGPYLRRSPRRLRRHRPDWRRRHGTGVARPRHTAQS